MAENSLALNTINDIDYMTKNNQDTLHLPNILTSINDHSSFYGIFNQIKQEYCSADIYFMKGCIITRIIFQMKMYI